MFSCSTPFQPQQVTVALTQLLHHGLRSLQISVYSAASASVQRLQKELSAAARHGPLLSEPRGSLKEGHLEELVSRLLPTLRPSSPSSWRTSHVSADTFLQNKHGWCSRGRLGAFGSPIFHGQHHRSPLKAVCSELRLWPAWVQHRGLNTLRRSRRSESVHDGPAETSFLKGLFTRRKGPDAQSLDQLVKQKNLPDNQQDTFKIGFAEGFMRSQDFTQRALASRRRTRLFLWSLLLIGAYGLYKSQIVTFTFTTSGLDTSRGTPEPVQMKEVTFEHVKGVQEAKDELQGVVEFLRNPQKFTVLGGKLPKGILLVGPPGTGKTLLARAVAGEADVPFFYACGSEFDEMFVGTGASRIRDLFREAKANAPCVIFLDELDSVGGKKTASELIPYARQTINQLLTEMDGFIANEGVIVIGATNYASDLDRALIRPGRFDMQVMVPLPDVKGRTEILNWYLSKIRADSSMKAETIARGTVGFSGADLENLVNQAALKAAVDEKKMVSMQDLEFAKDKILMGPERRSMEIDEKNKTITAYHESGHAIVAYYTKDAMPINKASIMPRGPSLGHVSLLPENDRWNETRAQLLAQMDVFMGGRVAEELIYGEDQITTGASSDFDKATSIAKMMVTRFGMSDKLGVMTYTDRSKPSPETQSAIEQEVRVLLKDSYERAKHLLKTHSEEHKTLADALLTHETLDAKEIKLLLEGKSLSST